MLNCIYSVVRLVTIDDFDFDHIFIFVLDFYGNLVESLQMRSNDFFVKFVEGAKRTKIDFVNGFNVIPFNFDFGLTSSNISEHFFVKQPKRIVNCDF